MNRTSREGWSLEQNLQDQSAIWVSVNWPVVHLHSWLQELWCGFLPPHRVSGTRDCLQSRGSHTDTCTRCFLYRSAGRVTWPVYNYAQCNMLSMIVLFLRPSFFKRLQIFDYSAHFLIIVKFLPAFDPGSLSVRPSVYWRWASLDVSINQSLIQI